MNNAANNSSKSHRKTGVSSQNKYDPLLVEPYNYSDCEQGVWRAVIVQALMDASSNSAKKESLQAKEEALVWLRGKSIDFASVCHYAGFEPSFVKEMARQALQRNCIWRAAPNSVHNSNSANSPNSEYRANDNHINFVRKHTQFR